MHVRPRNQKIFVLHLLLLQAVICEENDYKEAHRRGGAGGIEHKIVCPYGGAITGVNYRYASSVNQITFICTSSIGNTTFGPYGGGSGGDIVSARCPMQHYVSSFYGSNTTKLNRVGIRCRHESDMWSHGKIERNVGEEKGTHFDDLSISIGMRPVSVTVHTSRNEEVDAIQVTYGNVPMTGRPARQIDHCNEPWAPRHGQPEGKFDSFVCPDDGAITEIYTSYDDIAGERTLVSLLFKCNSSEGMTEHGPYGSGNRNYENLSCPDNHHVQYFFGFVKARIILLNVVCTYSGETVKSQDEQVDLQKNKTSNEFSTDFFSDSCYTTNARRAVQVNIYHTFQYVSSIQIKYVNIPVAVGCERTKITIEDEIPSLPTGVEVIGIASGSTCSFTPQQLCLTVVDDFSVTNGSGTRHSHGVKKTTAGGLQFKSGPNSAVTSVLVYFPFVNIDNVVSWESTNLLSWATEWEKSISTTVSYEGPGAGIVVAFKMRYAVTAKAYLVNYHYTCAGGSRTPFQDSIPLESKRFSNIFFQDYQFPFESAAQCTSKARTCIANIKFDNFLFYPKLLENRLRTEFRKCLN